MNRRIKAAALDPEVIAGMLRPRAHDVRITVEEGVPEDAVLEGVHFDIYRNCFVLAFSHPDWPEVPPNVQPEMIAPLFRATQVVPQSEALRESLAALEHEQWALWAQWQMDHSSPDNVERWKRQIATPYAELSEREKDSDREWADKVLALLRAHAD